MYDRSHEEIKAGADDACDYSPAEAQLHDAHLLMLEVAVGGLHDPVEAAVLLGVVDLAEGAVQHEHAEPLEAAQPLVQDEALEVQEPEQAQQLARGVEVLYYCAVLEDEIGEVKKQDVALLEMGEVYSLKLKQSEEPSQF